MSTPPTACVFVALAMSEKVDVCEIPFNIESVSKGLAMCGKNGDCLRYWAIQNRPNDDTKNGLLIVVRCVDIHGVRI